MTFPKVAPRPGRTKRTRKKDRVATADEKRHIERCKCIGCECCNQLGINSTWRLEYHHERPRGAIQEHMFGFCLCMEHHQATFPKSRHKLGREGFTQEWFDPEERAELRKQETVAA